MYEAAPGSIIFYEPMDAPVWVTIDRWEIRLPELSDRHLESILRRFWRRIDNEDFQLLVVEWLYRQDRGE